MPARRRTLAAAGVFAVLSLATPVRAQSLRGVNLAGPEFASSKLPGIYGQDYLYPTGAEITYFTSHGMNVFRLPVLWERLQPKLDGKLDPAELGRLKSVIAQAESHGAATIIDIHNYGYYRGTLIGQNGVTAADFADLWARLARQFGHDDHVMFGLMNEPKQNDAAAWQNILQQAITAIRATGAPNRILVSGIGWDGAANFPTTSGPTMARLADPRHRLLIEVHQYFDGGASGVSDRCVGPSQAAARLAPFTAWLRAHHRQGFLGEFGVSRRPECLAALSRVAAYLQANADVWRGWTYWAAGPLWGEYMYTLEPKNGAARPQMNILQPYLSAPGKQPE